MSSPHKASIAQQFGVDREVAQGHAWIDELGREPTEGVSEILLLEEINVEIDKLEGELKKRFPRQPKRVAAYLAPLSAKRSPEPDKEEDGDSPDKSDS